MSYVYWIHDDSHIDKTSEGYIGVTENPQKRFATHVRNKRVPENSTIDIIFEGTREDCFNLERELRPNKNIGWNNAAGGSHGWKIGFSHSDETRQRLKSSWTDERRKMAAAQRPEHSAKLIGRKRPEHSSAMSGPNNPMFGTKRPDHVRKAISDAHKGKSPSNKLEFYCILCRQRSSPTIIAKYHGLGKKHCQGS